MSKIYKALEKAEREREKEFKEDHLSIPKRDEQDEQEQPEKPGKRPNLFLEKRMHCDPRLVSFCEPWSLAAEQFRKLRTQLLQHRFPNPPRTIMVTSGNTEEGKTLISSNLAAGIAHDLQSYALLVDCDFRNPSLSKWLGLENEKGLSDYLTGKGEIPDLLLKTDVKKLSLLSAGSIQENPTELIGSKKMEALVQELKSRYKDRFVIFDSSPLLMTSESEVLSRFVDGILVVVRAGATPREVVKRALSSLEKGKVLGFVLNDLQFKSSGMFSRYFGKDGYYSRYGYGQRTQPQRRWLKQLPASYRGRGRKE